MDKFYKKTLYELELAINELEIETDCPIQRIEAVIVIIVSSLSKLKEFVLKRDFINIDEEIRFFKHQKPVIVSKLIYYNTIYKIETRRPYGTKRIRKYFTKELKKLKRFFDNNLDFYKYYRSNNSFVDEKFFVRGKHDIRLWLDTCLIRVLACFGYFVVAFCPYMPIGIYGQRKSSTFCVLLSNTRADVAKGLYPYTLRGKF